MSKLSTQPIALQGGAPVNNDPWPTLMLGPEAIGDEEIAAVTAVLRSKNLFRFLDPETSQCAQLERHFREMTGCSHALAVGGGTGALICALIGLGVGDGDEVIIPAYTYIASASAVLICGAVPVIAEIDESLTIDPASIEANITPRTKAIMPVHMRGYGCDMEAIMRIAAKHGLRVIEDTAQACGATWRGRRLGSIGDVGTFSLQQYKIITAGEGGVIVTNDANIFERAALRHDSAMCYWNAEDHGNRPVPGENFRMNEMSGALACVQFGRLDGIIARCRALRQQVLDRIEGLPGIQIHQPHNPEGDCGISLGLFLPTAEKAETFAKALSAEGIPCGSLYDKGIPDRHIYCYWEYVLEKNSADPLGRPWTSPAHDSERRYSPDMCPRTLDILGRTIMLSFSQSYEDKHAAMMAEAIAKVARALAE
jgi:dTDP-4-amino-4,6-dideoxygalactose transaminase